MESTPDRRELERQSSQFCKLLGEIAIYVLSLESFSSIPARGCHFFGNGSQNQVFCDYPEPPPGTEAGTGFSTGLQGVSTFVGTGVCACSRLAATLKCDT
jgi:hypothetical protein